MVHSCAANGATTVATRDGTLKRPRAERELAARRFVRYRMTLPRGDPYGGGPPRKALTMADKKKDKPAEKKAECKKCEGDLHKQHLCYLMYEGFHYSNRAEFKKLVHEAEYVCMNCGRTAKHDASLCAPAKL
jgi:hypothetical protein